MMQYKIFGCLIGLCFLVQGVSAQGWKIYLNGNETYPFGDNQQSYYPILWYSADEGRGVLVGGFGGGVSYTTAPSGRYQLKYQLNLQRSRFYDHPTIFNNENGEALIGSIGINTNLNTALLVIPQIVLGDHFSAGLGLGMRYTFYSITDYGEAFFNGEKKKLKERNYSQTPFVAILPVEITGILGRFSLTTRLEPSITNVSRLDAFSGDRSAVLFLELGYRLR